MPGVPLTMIIGGHRVVGTGGGAESRQLADRIADIGIRVAPQLIGADHRDRRGLLIAADRNARSADDDLLDISRFGGTECRFLIILRGSRRGGGRSRDGWIARRGPPPESEQPGHQLTRGGSARARC